MSLGVSEHELSLSVFLSIKLFLLVFLNYYCVYQCEEFYYVFLMPFFLAVTLTLFDPLPQIQIEALELNSRLK